MRPTTRNPRSRQPKRLTPLRQPSDPTMSPITPTRSPHSLALPPLPVTRARTNSDPTRPRSCERRPLDTPPDNIDLMRSCSVPRITRDEARQHGAGMWFSRGDAVRVVSGDNGGKIGEVSRWEPMREKWLVRLQEMGGTSKLYWITSERLAPAYGYSDKTTSSHTPDLPPSTPTTPKASTPTLSANDIEGLSHGQLKEALVTRGAQSKGLRSRLVRILKNILAEEDTTHRRKTSNPTPRRTRPRRTTPPGQQRPAMSNNRSSPLPWSQNRKGLDEDFNRQPLMPQPSNGQLRSTPRVLTAKARRMLSAPTSEQAHARRSNQTQARHSDQARYLNNVVGKMFHSSKLTLDLTTGREECPGSDHQSPNGEEEPHPDTPRHNPRLGMSEENVFRRESVKAASPRSLHSNNLREHRMQYEPRSHFMLARFLKAELAQRPVQARQRLVMKLKTSYNRLKATDYHSPALNAALKTFDLTEGDVPKWLFDRITASPEPDPLPQKAQLFLAQQAAAMSSPKDSGVSAPRSPTGLVITTRHLRPSIPETLLKTPSPI